MAMILKVRPGLSAPLVNAIPSQWDAAWFRRWITDFLNTVQIASGVMQVIAGAGIAVSPAGGTGAVTISVGSSGVITSVVGTANEIAVSTTGTTATLSFPSNVIFPAAPSGTTVTVDGSTTSSSALIVNVANISTDLSIKILAPTGTANTLSSGGSIGVTNGTSSGFALQSSGNQTEVWQYEPSGSWHQVASWNSLYSFVVNGQNAVTPGSSQAMSVVTNNGVFNATNIAYSALVIYSTNSSAQTSLDFSINGSLYGRFRSDYAGNMSYVSTLSGYHYFWTGGDSGVGTNPVQISAAGLLINTGASVYINNGTFIRNSNNGYLNGNYSTYETGLTAGCIYSIGSTYIPNQGTTNALGSLYGIGFTTSATTDGTGATIASKFTGASSGVWGCYVSSSGHANIWMDSDNGVIYTATGVKTNGYVSAGTIIGTSGGDVTANRGGTGVIYLGTGSTYLYYNGSGYVFGGSNQVQAGSFNAVSDERWKDSIRLIPDALEKVRKLRGATWVWNERAQNLAGQRGAGLIAQDVERVLAEAVSDGGSGANGEPEHKSLNYAATNGLLVEAVKELLVRVERLEKLAA